MAGFQHENSPQTSHLTQLTCPSVGFKELLRGSKKEMVCILCFVFLCRFVKFSMPSVPDFETLFSQVQLFISTCNGEHIRYATDTCKCHLPSCGLLRQNIYWFSKELQMNVNFIPGAPLTLILMSNLKGTICGQIIDTDM